MMVMKLKKRSPASNVQLVEVRLAEHRERVAPALPAAMASAIDPLGPGAFHRPADIPPGAGPGATGEVAEPPLPPRPIPLAGQYLLGLRWNWRRCWTWSLGTS